MSFQYTSGNPNNLVGNTAANMADIQGPFTDLKTFLNNRIAAVPSLAVSLPVSPVDGQEIYYLADSTNGVVWHLRYRSASGSTYKWEFIGGGSLHSEVATLETRGTLVTFGDLATVGPSVTVPLAGEYEISFGAWVETNSVTGATGEIAPSIAGATPTTADIIFGATSAAQIVDVSPARTIWRTAAASNVIKLQYWTNNLPNKFGNRFLGVKPVRVG